jgi:hypothetical protein
MWSKAARSPREPVQMSPSLIVGGAFGLGLLSLVGYAYFKGEKSCKDSFLVKELQQKVVEQAKQIKNSQDAALEADKLSQEAQKDANTREQVYSELIAGLDVDNPDGPICADVGFLRKLRGLHK